MAPSRGSIFGALLLIAIGGLFLWANLDPSLRPWYLIGRYWPVLIIFWGLGKLVDYLSLRGTPEATRAARLSGGDIFLLIFILLLGTAISRATQRSFWSDIGINIEDEEWGRWFEDRFQFTEQFEQTLKTPAVLNISNIGSVTLVAQEGDRLQGSIRKVIYAPTEAEAERRAKDVQIVLEPMAGAQAGNYQLRWRQAGEEFGPARADLELRVPARVGVKVASRRGDVHLEGLRGDISIELSRGKAEVVGTTGSVKVQTRSGSVQVENVRGDVEVRGRGDQIVVQDIRGEARLEGEFAGPIRAANVTGETRFVSRRTNFTAERIEGELELARGDLNLRRSAGNITLLAEDKDISFDDLAGAVRVENRHGTIQLRFARPPREPLEAESRSGDIELILPGNSAFTMDARTQAGEISSDFTGAALELKHENGGATLTGSYGARGPAIRLHTRYGSIRLLRSTPAAGEPARR